ncbi:MAG: hypothetical protein KIH62_002065 [Candidatus Kerfeldbacteria bacterium]|nr:hypothetical protein [Candidatus Kerfeldbacteria bacterium]
MKKLWFRAKRFGYGWYPSTWEGWLVVIFGLAIVAVIVALNGAADDIRIITHVATPVFIVVIVLCYITYLTGETAHWNWSWEKTKREKELEIQDIRLKHKKSVTLTCIFAIALCTVIMVFGNAMFSSYVRSQIDAVACTKSGECARLGDYCVYGCNVEVRTVDADRIQSLIDFSNVAECDITCPYLPE